MIEILKTIALGIVQGLTEFLPVSSSGHLAVLRVVLGMEEDLFTDVMLHFGTLIAVVVFYFRELIGLFRKENHRTLLHLVIATIPAVVVMAVLKFVLKMEDFSAKFVCFGFLATGIILLLTEFIGKKVTEPKPLNGKSALIMGIAQAVAVIPGLSRSGSTIAAGVLSGTDRKEVTKFSFFMSVPIIAGSALVSVLGLLTSEGGTTDVNILATLCGMAAAAVCGFFAIKVMIRLIGKCNFKWFSLYLFVLSVVTFITLFL